MYLICYLETYSFNIWYKNKILYRWTIWISLSFLIFKNTSCMPPSIICGSFWNRILELTFYLRFTLLTLTCLCPVNIPLIDPHLPMSSKCAHRNEVNVARKNAECPLGIQSYWLLFRYVHFVRTLIDRTQTCDPIIPFSRKSVSYRFHIALYSFSHFFCCMCVLSALS